MTDNRHPIFDNRCPTSDNRYPIIENRRPKTYFECRSYDGIVLLQTIAHRSLAMLEGQRSYFEGFFSYEHERGVPGAR